MDTNIRDKKPFHILLIALIFCILINGAVWFSLRGVRAKWANVPPTPSAASAALSTLGDRQFAYRMTTLFLQNLGDTGGRVTNLREYNYIDLGKWFDLTFALDPYSNAAPTVAGYVYGANQNTSELGPIIDYLEKAGSVMKPQKWRWQLHAIFLARHRMKDYDRALDIANKLANRDEEGLPAFTKQAPAFVMNVKGDKQAALMMMTNLLKSEGEKLPPSEVNNIIAYICEQILSPEEAQMHDLCTPMR